jgi:hypothetical protein
MDDLYDLLELFLLILTEILRGLGEYFTGPAWGSVASFWGG